MLEKYDSSRKKVVDVDEGGAPRPRRTRWRRRAGEHDNHLHKRNSQKVMKAPLEEKRGIKRRMG